MEQKSSIATINRTAALQIPTIRDAYERIGVSCQPTSPVLRPMVNRLKGMLDIDLTGFSQEQRYEGMA